MSEINNQPPEICPNCQSPVKERSGTSKKTGKEYHFWGCSNYPNCRFIWHPEKKDTKATPIKDYDQGEIIIKKLNQILYLITGVHPEQHKAEFEDILKDRLGKGMFEVKEIPVGEPPEEKL